MKATPAIPYSHTSWPDAVASTMLFADHKHEEVVKLLQQTHSEELMAAKIGHEESVNGFTWKIISHYRLGQVTRPSRVSSTWGTQSMAQCVSISQIPARPWGKARAIQWKKKKKQKTKKNS
ncbi:hypothetical protein ACN38_g2805 [Penicillium nordicum]|uniref:Uncharacterized protein n=1 Tax=Penicillium nordicum TaxID=229535 RepID=A0A0M8P6P6_9EURO|nr:hypothetical protein ACN38_g2805 [Penicillium nordicum]